MTLRIKHILIQTDNIWPCESQIQVLQDLRKVKARHEVDQLPAIRLVNIRDLSVRHRLRACGVERLEDLPVVLLPALVTGNTVRVEEALQRLGVGAV